jgi:hypothetical protein
MVDSVDISKLVALVAWVAWADGLVELARKRRTTKDSNGE